MPQISPMKWFILNILVQTSVLQVASFLSMKKNYTLENSHPKMVNSKFYWKW